MTQGAIQQAWSEETAYNGQWDPENPAKGQCAVSALLVQDLLGGRIVKVNFAESWDRKGSHYYNVLDDGFVVDLTRGQFASTVRFTSGHFRLREHLLANPDTAKRYALLKWRFDMVQSQSTRARLIEMRQALMVMASANASSESGEK